MVMEKKHNRTRFKKNKHIYYNEVCTCLDCCMVLIHDSCSLIKHNR